MKPRVLFIVGSYPPQYTGAGLRAHRLARHLEAQHEVSVCVVTNGLTPRLERERYDGVDVTRLPYPRAAHLPGVRAIRRLRIGAGILGTQVAVAQWLRANRSRFDIVHAFGAGPLTLTGIGVAQIVGLPTILELTLMGVDDAVTVVGKSIFGPVGRALKRRIFARLDACVCVSAQLRASCESIGYPAQRIWHRANPVDGDRFAPPESKQERAAIRERLGLAPDRRLLVTVGRICARKNQAFLIDALAQVPRKDVDLVLVGPLKGEEDRNYLESLEARAAEAGVRERVHWFVDLRQDVPDFLKAADVFVFASRSEGSPNVVLEALSAGLPVVGANLCGVLDEFVHDGDGDIAPADSTPSDLAARLSPWLDGDGDRPARARRATDRFSMTRAVDGYIDLYHRMLAM